MNQLKTGAVIVTAGVQNEKSGQGPMISVGNMTAAQRIVTTLHREAICHIVMVTGYNALELEKHLTKLDLVYLRNPAYAATDMFASVRIGLGFMREKCDRVLITPMDIPLFKASTVRALRDTDADAAVPVCDGVTGHPVMISTKLIPDILNYQGDGGLWGALGALAVPIVRVPVDDKGILNDSTQMEIYEELLKYHNDQIVRPVVRLSLAREQTFFNVKLAMLLHLTEETGSVREACERITMSYTAGWNAIRTMEEQTGRTLIKRNQGGASDKRSYLTEDGIELLRRFDAFNNDIRLLTFELYQNYFGGFFVTDDTEKRRQHQI